MASIPEQHQPPVGPPQHLHETHQRARRRAAWRQRLVDAERGISQSFRSESTLFVHFFVACIILAAGFVLQITLMQWAMLILSLTLVVASELFHLVLKTVWLTVGHHFDERMRRSLRMGTAGVVVTIAGCALVILLILGQQLVRAFGT